MRWIEGGIVNVAIAEQPVVPALPVWPAGVVVLGGFGGRSDVGHGSCVRGGLSGSCTAHAGGCFGVFEDPGLGFATGRNGQAVIRLKEMK